MDVKWGLMDAGSLMTVDYGTVMLTYSGRFVPMNVFDIVTAPKPGFDGFVLPEGQELIVIGGRDSMSAALLAHGPTWRSTSTLQARGLYLKSGNLFSKNITLLILTGEPQHTLGKYRGMRPGPICEVKIKGDSDYVSLMPSRDLAFFVKTL